MSLKFAPRIVYDTGVVTTIDFSLSMRLWEYEEGVGMGDEDESAAGVPESYWVRYDQKSRLVLRYTDAERVAVMTWLEWSMKNKGSSFTFRFDQADAGTAYTVYLDAPKTGELVKPSRAANAPWTWELPIVIRSVNGTRFDVQLPLT